MVIFVIRRLKDEGKTQSGQRCVLNKQAVIGPPLSAPCTQLHHAPRVLSLDGIYYSWETGKK